MKKYQFICNGDISDLVTLKNLLEFEDIFSEFEQKNVKGNEMGAEQILIALIGSAVIPSIIKAIEVWLCNRSIALTIKDEAGREINIQSKNGKIDANMLEQIKSFFLC